MSYLLSLKVALEGLAHTATSGPATEVGRGGEGREEEEKGRGGEGKESGMRKVT